MSALHLLGQRAGHVVAEIIKAEFVVGAIRDVACVVFALLRWRVPESWDDETNAEAKPLVNATHPFSMETRQVIVDGNDVDTLARQTIEISRKS